MAKMLRRQREAICSLALNDVTGLEKAQETYGDSWKQRGGVGAFMMLARKWDRIENQVSKSNINFDILKVAENEVADNLEDLLDDIRDLRRYLLLVEAEAYLVNDIAPRVDPIWSVETSNAFEVHD